MPFKITVCPHPLWLNFVCVLLPNFPLARVELYTKLCEELFWMYALYFNCQSLESFENFYQVCEPLPFQLFLAWYLPVCWLYLISYVPNFNNFLWCWTCVNMMMLSPDKVCVRLIWLLSLYLPSYWKARAKLSSNKSFSQAGFKPIYHQLIKLNPKVFINFHGNPVCLFTVLFLIS